MKFLTAVPALAIASCVVLWLLSGGGAHHPAPRKSTQPSASLPQVLEEPTSSLLMPVRSDADWVPDGRVWLSVVDESGSTCEQATVSKVSRDSRWFLPVQEAKHAGSQWLAMDPPGAGECLAVVVPGCRVHWLLDPATAHRHVVSVEQGPSVGLMVWDETGRRTVEGVGCALSLLEISSDPPPAGALPGYDPAKAVYSGVSDSQGRVRLPLETPDVPLLYRVMHAHYLPSMAMEDTISVSGEQAVLSVVEPWIAAIDIVGDEVIGGGITTRMASPRSDVARERLEECAARIRSRWGKAMIAVVMPIPGTAQVATARVVLAHHGEREYPLELVPLSEFSGPREVVVESGSESAAMAVELTVDAPEPAVGWPRPEFQLVLSGSGRRTLANFGQATRLAPGRYRVSAAGMAAAAALQRDEVVVEAGAPRRFQARWRSGVTCCEFDVSSSSGVPPRRVVLVRHDDHGQQFAVEVMLDEKGHGWAWCRGEVGSIRLMAAHHAPLDIAPLRVGQDPPAVRVQAVLRQVP